MPGTFKVILDEPHHVYFTGSYEQCKQFIRASRIRFPLDILSVQTGRLVSYIL